MFSQEGTTQGNLLEMSMYGIVNILLIEFSDDCFNVQKWYTDDGNAVGSPDNLKKHFGSPKKHSRFGYHLTKCHIITQEHLFGKAQQNFVHDQEQIVNSCRVLSIIGSFNAANFVERSL